MVRRRNRALFDEHNTEPENLKLVQLVEHVFSTEESMSTFLDLPIELYCQALSEHLNMLKRELSNLPEFT